ncbi:MAG: PHP domain-containing protein [Bacillota bacterium]|nr:PHP domain-containing protein [Bacillota bacterium]
MALEARLFDAGLDSVERLDALTRLAAGAPRPASQGARPVVRGDVNSHIHSTYSFSPYTPAAAAWRAWQAGLATAGLMDHDAILGAGEFIRAGELLGLPVTVGTEVRASFARTPLATRRINNPDQKGIGYITFHGVPHTRIEALDRWLRPIRRARDERNRAMIQRLNQVTVSVSQELALDYESDVLPLSMQAKGGEVTERHLLYALSLRMIALGDPLVFVETLGLPLADSARARLADAANPHRAYDLLGVLKSDLVERFYVDADEVECPPIAEVVAFAAAHEIIAAYPYLGDVGISVTGDKRTQTFEDPWLDELFEVLDALGFGAITYMPSRNTRAQLERLRARALAFGLFEISGEDINQPRQPFVCEAMRDPWFAHLMQAAWALIGHEQAATRETGAGFFSTAARQAFPDLETRIAHYAELGGFR